MALQIVAPILNAYDQTQKWLAQQSAANGYQRIANHQDIDLNAHDLRNTAAQFDTYMPGHMHKICKSLQELGKTEDFDFCKQETSITFLDIGCGGGAASAAFIDHLLYTAQELEIDNKIDLLCIGVDMNPSAVKIYEQFLGIIQTHLRNTPIHLRSAIFQTKLPDVLQLQGLINLLNQTPHLVVLQSNMIDLLHYQYRDAGQQALFGILEATAYHDLLDAACVSDAFLMTITDTQHGNKSNDFHSKVPEIFYQEQRRWIINDLLQSLVLEVESAAIPTSRWARLGYATRTNPFHVNATHIVDCTTCA